MDPLHTQNMDCNVVMTLNSPEYKSSNEKLGLWALQRQSKPFRLDHSPFFEFLKSLHT